MKNYYILSILFLLFHNMAGLVRVIVGNPVSMQRQDLVEIDAQSVYMQLGIHYGQPFVVSQVVAKNEDGSEKLREVDFQVTHDQKILIDASVQPNQENEYVIMRGVPRKMQRYNTLTQRTTAGGWGG